MRTITFFRLRFLINFAFIILAILIPLMICKNYQADLEDGIEIWLIVDGLILIIQTIVNQFLKTIPVIPDVIQMPPPPKGGRKDE